MGRLPCCDKVGLKRGPWTIEEDHKLMNFILNNGIHCWRMVPKLAGLLRCGKSCRLRWINYLRPDLKRGGFTEAEENQMIQLHSCLGNRWSKIASHFPGRTDNEIKNHWNTRIKKRLKHLGVDPLTHKPVEYQKHIEENKDTITQHSNITSSSSEEGLEESRGTGLEAKLLEDSNGNKGFPESDEKSQNEVQLTTLDDANDISENYEVFCGSLDLGTLMLNQGFPNTSSMSNSYSTSFSVEDSNNASISIGETMQENCLQQWVDSVDSMLSWDGFNIFGQDLFFF
ncbi:hypothetical protein ACFX1Q_044744 [Malus domestica]